MLLLFELTILGQGLGKDCYVSEFEHVCTPTEKPRTALIEQVKRSGPMESEITAQ